MTVVAKSITWGLQNTDTAGLRNSCKDNTTGNRLRGDIAGTLEEVSGLDRTRAEGFADDFVGGFAKVRDIHEFQAQERKLRQRLKDLEPNIARRLQAIFQGSSGKSANEVSSLIDKHGKPIKSALDYGAGDGSVGAELKKKRPGLTKVGGADIMPPSQTQIPVTKIEPGANLPFAEGEFDAAFVINLLHHITDKDEQLKIIEQLERVVNSGLYVVETTKTDAADSQGRTLAADYFSNRIFRPIAFGTDDIPVPGTFRTEAEWNEVFEGKGFDVLHSDTSSGADRKNMATPHSRFVLGKKPQNHHISRTKWIPDPNQFGFGEFKAPPLASRREQLKSLHGGGYTPKLGKD